MTTIFEPLSWVPDTAAELVGPPTSRGPVRDADPVPRADAPVRAPADGPVARHAPQPIEWVAADGVTDELRRCMAGWPSSGRC